MKKYLGFGLFFIWMALIMLPGLLQIRIPHYSTIMIVAWVVIFIVPSILTKNKKPVTPDELEELEAQVKGKVKETETRDELEESNSKEDVLYINGVPVDKNGKPLK